MVKVGNGVGEIVGSGVGDFDGDSVGLGEGFLEGLNVGALVGEVVGATVGRSRGLLSRNTCVRLVPGATSVSTLGSRFGMIPVNLFPLMRNTSKLLNSPIVSGIVPLNWLFDRSNLNKLSMSLKERWLIVPENELFNTSTSWMLFGKNN